jgi:hypothetical protein
VAGERGNARGAKGVGHQRWIGSTGNGRNPIINGRRQPSLGGTSRMMREYHVRICLKCLPPQSCMAAPVRHCAVRDSGLRRCPVLRPRVLNSYYSLHSGQDVAREGAQIFHDLLCTASI